MYMEYGVSSQGVKHSISKGHVTQCQNEYCYVTAYLRPEEGQNTANWPMVDDTACRKDRLGNL